MRTHAGGLIIVRQERRIARAGKGDGNRGAERGRRPGKNRHDPIGEQDGLVHVVRDHHGVLAGGTDRAFRRTQGAGSDTRCAADRAIGVAEIGR